MKITKPKRFSIEFSNEELERLNKAILGLGEIMRTLEENDLSALHDSFDGNCLEISDISRIHDDLMDLIEMDEGF